MTGEEAQKELKNNNNKQKTLPPHTSPSPLQTFYALSWVSPYTYCKAKVTCIKKSLRSYLAVPKMFLSVLLCWKQFWAPELHWAEVHICISAYLCFHLHTTLFNIVKAFYKHQDPF